MRLQHSLLIAALVLPLLGQAQIKFPAPSPLCKVTQTVGLTEVQLEYSRPSVRDRKIFGELVPFGTIWRTGANSATQISFDQAVRLAGQEVPAGTYALYTIPGADSWTVMLNRDLVFFGSPDKYNQEEELIRFNIAPVALAEPVESFTILPTHLRDDKARISIMWENTAVHIPMELTTADRLERDIEKLLAGPDGRTYYQIARYYHETGVRPDKALEYIRIAVEQKGYDTYWALRTMALIQASAGDLQGAILSAEKSTAKAKAEGNLDYVRMNEVSIREWKGQ